MITVQLVASSDNINYSKTYVIHDSIEWSDILNDIQWLKDFNYTNIAMRIY